MRPNPLRAAMKTRRPIVNAWLSIPSPYLAEVAGAAGFDAVTVDLQHGMMGFETAVGMFQAISATAATPLARVTANDPAQVMRLLDAGAYGIICPMVSTAEDARRFVGAMRYPPTGSRSFGPARGLIYGGADYLAHADHEILALAMIETREGLENLAEILDTPGLDGIYIGPNDLALDLGFAPAAESAEPPVRLAVEWARSEAQRRGLLAGIFCSGAAAAAERITQGFGLVTPGNDVGALRAVWGPGIETCRAARPKAPCPA